MVENEVVWVLNLCLKRPWTFLLLLHWTIGWHMNNMNYRTWGIQIRHFSWAVYHHLHHSSWARSWLYPHEWSHLGSIKESPSLAYTSSKDKITSLLSSNLCKCSHLTQSWSHVTQDQRLIISGALVFLHIIFLYWYLASWASLITPQTGQTSKSLL